MAAAGELAGSDGERSPVLSLGEHRPQVHPSVFVAPTAVVVGRVRLAAEVSIWWGAVLRSEFDEITVGAGTNIQDLCVLHTDAGFPVRVGERVTVGHRAVVHGCTVEDGALIGMGALVLNGAIVGAGTLVGAGAVVTPGTVLPPGCLALGAPARPVRELSAADSAAMVTNNENYQRLRERYLAELG